VSFFILDTDTLTLFQRINPVVRAAVTAAQNAGHTVALTAITVEEQINGWFAAMRAARTHTDLARVSQEFANAVVLWGSFRVFPQTEPSLRRFDALVARKLNVGKMDLRIASIALELGATVVTHNTPDFARVPGLVTADWTLPPTPAPPTPATPPDDARKSSRKSMKFHLLRRVC
jgi:tRNA(fMet)-specific endonuclease VapC